jgi:hypothetical protein
VEGQPCGEASAEIGQPTKMACIIAAKHHQCNHHNENVRMRASGTGTGAVVIPAGLEEEAMLAAAAAVQVAKHVDLEGSYLEFSVRKLQSTSLKHQRMVMTRDLIAFGAPGGDAFDDVIPLSEIHRVHDCSDPGRSEGSWDVVPGMFVLTTAPSGVNSGRSYCLAAEFPLQSTGKNVEGRPALSLVPDPSAVVETQVALLRVMEALIREAQIRAKSKTLGAKFARSRLVVKHVFMSLPLQLTVALLLTTNFVANAGDCG